ncbi:hypothetical protein [Dactylosporangium sp. CA-139066]|uniref:hypothetical protein n=1 Tax=Dactylosporangium sp. CA-139066 TaxID=3239930 RepID=UPI003D8A7460
MNYDDEQARTARRGLAWGKAETLWSDGARGAAVAFLRDAGWDDDVVPFCLARGLTAAEADQMAQRVSKVP